MAPTNKACRVMNDETTHKFIAQFNPSYFKDYIYINEISMMREVLYILIYLKRAEPELKFILVGDFDQLPPVNDKLGHRCFNDSNALYELFDGNKKHLQYAEDPMTNYSVCYKRKILIRLLKQLSDMNLLICI